MSAKKTITIKIGTQFYYHYEEDDLDFITILNFVMQDSDLLKFVLFFSDVG